MFEIGRIRFRPFTREDLSFIERWENEYDVTLYSRGKPLVFKNRDEIEKGFEEYLKDEDEQRFIIELKEDNKCIGMAKYEDHSRAVRNADIGTYIGEKDYWNRGIGKEIAFGFLEILIFHKNYDRVVAWSASINKRAHKVLEALGFKKSGIARKSGYLFGKRIDWYMFDILREEYMKNRDDYMDMYLEDKQEYIREHCRLKRPIKKKKENKEDN